jgi:hypothetical protein
MLERLRTLTPATPARTHLLLAAIMWTVVGALLVVFGGRWALRGAIPHAGVLLAVAVAVGLVKARYVLSHTARHTIARIRSRGDGRCIGGFLSVRSWGLVLLMSIGGRLLRGGPIPSAVVGLIYTAVGTALLVAGLRIWQAWHRYTTPV